jgi:hypothetical protein
MKKIGFIIGVIFLLTSFYGCTGATGSSPGKEEISTVPGAPTALKIAIVQNGFKLSWNLSPQDPGIVTGYEIIRSELASGPFIKVATLDKGVSQYIDATASREIIYYYKVRALAGSMSSPDSNTVTGER